MDANSFEPVSTPGRATLTVEAGRRSPHPVNSRLFGKFCEHLGANIYHGMEAQILLNCTFGQWRFAAGDHPDGGVWAESSREKIERRIAAIAQRNAWPDPQALVAAYFDGGAFGWFRIGAPDEVLLSPDTGPHGGRAQRVEIQTQAETGRGIGQWTYLPLHRTRTYLFRVVARAVAPCELTLGLGPASAPDASARASIRVGPEWQTFTGTLCLPADAPVAALYRFAVTCDAPANVLLGRALLYPGDHVGGADPDVVRLLKESRLPLLRWPGGNFVSGYHWRDGVGPVDARLTLPNPAWDGLEFNLFGTDEFLAFCRAVGCEPLICVNAGNGTAAEAAAWVEYCNGAPDTPMGRLRAANGHPEPYRVTHWEIGNEIYGRWQVSWTTPAGNADRYRRFREAMLAADPALKLLGCGYGNEPDSEWNRRLIADAGKNLRSITDHILTGGSVSADTDPAELYHAFMGYPAVLERRYRDLHARMRAAGNPAPRMAITELQLFAFFHGEVKPGGQCAPELLPRPDTIAEALFLAMIVNACVRLGDFVELLTHSATVNHGGGLRKERERVYANPVHYAHALGIALAGGTPVAVRLACETFATQHAFSHIPPQTGVPILDALAVITPGGDLALMLIHRGAACGPVALDIALAGFRAQARAEVVTLAGTLWNDRNTLGNPGQVAPRSALADVREGRLLSLHLPPFSLTRVLLKNAGPK